MQKEMEERFLEEIDYIKTIKSNTQEVEWKLEYLQEELGGIFETQKSLLKYIEFVFKNKCWLETDPKFKALKDRILSSIADIWKISWESKKKLEEIKKYTDKSLSLIKSFYEKSTRDSLTWLRNEEFIINLIDILWEDKKPFTIVYLDLNNLKKANDTYWHSAGDTLIKEFAKKLKLLFWDDKNFVARIHWDEFNIVSTESIIDIDKKLKKLDTWLENQKVTIHDENWKEHKIYMWVAYGYASTKEEWIKDKTTLVRVADKRMYEDKLAKKLWNRN